MQAKPKFERLKNDVWFKPVSADLQPEGYIQSQTALRYYTSALLCLAIKIKINPGNFKLQSSISMESEKV